MFVTVYKLHDTSSLFSLVMYLPIHCNIVFTVAALKDRSECLLTDPGSKSNAANYFVSLWANFLLSQSLKLCSTYIWCWWNVILCTTIRSLALDRLWPRFFFDCFTLKLCQKWCVQKHSNWILSDIPLR